MKKVLFGFLMMMISVSVCFGADYCISSGTKAVAGGNIAITSAPAKLCGVVITTDGTNTATIEIWDNTSAAAPALFNMTVLGADLRGGALFPYPIAASTALFLDFNTCTGCSVEVYYRP